MPPLRPIVDIFTFSQIVIPSVFGSERPAGPSQEPSATRRETIFSAFSVKSLAPSQIWPRDRTRCRPFLASAHARKFAIVAYYVERFTRAAARSRSDEEFLDVFLQQHTPQHNDGWLFLLAVFRCSFADAIVKTSRNPPLALTLGCFFAAFISDISRRLILVECPSPQPSPGLRGEGAWPRVGLTLLIKLAVTPTAA